MAFTRIHNPISIEFDLRSKRVEIDGRAVSGRWNQLVHLYAALILRWKRNPRDPAFLTAEQLRQIGPWRNKAQAATVGVMVANHVNRTLKPLGVHAILESRKKTQAWRLDPRVAIVRCPATARRLEDWLEAESGAALRTGYVDHVSNLVRASIDFNFGRFDDVLENVPDPKELRGLDARDQLASWAGLLRGRAAQRSEDVGAFDRVLADWPKGGGAAQRAVRARLLALRAMRGRYDDPKAEFRSLSKLASELEESGDFSSLASVVNVLGLLAKRADRLDEAEEHHARALPLFAICGDYPSLQAVLFNLAVVRAAASEAAGEAPDDATMSLIDLCLEVCDQMRVGHDSVRAECAGAVWACARGEEQRAQSYLERADENRTEESDLEIGWFRYAQGTLSAVRGERARATTQLKLALRRFGEVGDEVMMERIRGMLKANAQRG